MEILHPWHAHPLFLCDEEAKFGDGCSICEKAFDGNPFYACVDCEYYVHKSCAQLPVEIQHHFHPPHPLSLCFGSGFSCDSCHKAFENELRFRCSACDFDLDVKCALMSDIDTGGKEFITHFTHQHPLTICRKDGDNLLNCFACKKTSSDLIYGCTLCDYFLHKSCSELSTYVLHAMHPQHALSLVVKYGTCDYCRIHDHTWKYYCSICNFCLDVSCLDDSAKDAQNSERSCFVCGKQHLNSDSCVNSLYFINQSCIKLPEAIEHEFHSHKPLLLLGSKGFGCDSCHKWFVRQSHYGCEECDFQMDVKCALMPSVQYDLSDASIWPVIPHHFNHQHPLQLIKEVHDIHCSVCDIIKRSPIYGCTRCEYFVHQSCLELPVHIEHPLHASHVLTVQPLLDNLCQICCKNYAGFAFGCIQCLFFIGMECIWELGPTVTLVHKYHHHPLYLIEKSYCDRCNSDNTFCNISQESSEFRLTKSYSLRCIECDYNLHFLCGPLPCTIKHKSHFHALKLLDSIVEDDSDEYYCDICEEMRNPRLCVYLCVDCKFFAHIHCVISEIINVFNKNLENVELRIVGDLRFEETMNPLYDNLSEELLLDLLKLLDATEMRTLRDYFPYRKLFIMEEDIWEMQEEKLSFKVETRSFLDELSLINDDGGSIFMERLISFKPDTKYQISRDECNQPVIEVQGYKVTSNFASLFKALLLRYGDFGRHSKQTKNIKSIVLYFLCRVVSDMRRTYVEDITENQLFTWFCYINGISKIGFDLDFVESFLFGSVISYFGLWAMKFEEEAASRIDCDIEKVTKKIFDLEIEKQTLELHRKNYRLGEMVKKSSRIKTFFTVAKQQKYKIAGEGIV